MRSALRIALFLLPVLAACKEVQSTRVAFYQMQPAGEHFLLLGHVPDELTSHQGLGRVALIDKEGTVQHSIEARTVFGFVGISNDTIWLTRTAPTLQLSAHRLKTLERIPGISEAIAKNAALAISYTVAGLHAGDPVLVASNGRKYTITAKGVLAKLPKGAKAEPPPRTKAGKRDLVPIPGQPVPKAPKARAQAIAEALDNAWMLAQSRTLLGPKSKDILIAHTVAKASGPAAHLSRVDPSGKAKWTADLSTWAQPSKAQLKTQLVSIVSGSEGTWLLLRAESNERYQNTDYYEVEHRLVQVDWATGRATRSMPIAKR